MPDVKLVDGPLNGKTITRSDGSLRDGMRIFFNIPGHYRIEWDTENWKWIGWYEGEETDDRPLAPPR